MSSNYILIFLGNTSEGKFVVKTLALYLITKRAHNISEFIHVCPTCHHHSRLIIGSWCDLLFFFWLRLKHTCAIFPRPTIYIHQCEEKAARFSTLLSQRDVWSRLSVAAAAERNPAPPSNPLHLLLCIASHIINRPSPPFFLPHPESLLPLVLPPSICHWGPPSLPLPLPISTRTFPIQGSQIAPTIQPS